jgi:hypothetical protein
VAIKERHRFQRLATLELAKDALEYSKSTSCALKTFIDSSL